MRVMAGPAHSERMNHIELKHGLLDSWLEVNSLAATVSSVIIILVPTTTSRVTIVRTSVMKG